MRRVLQIMGVMAVLAAAGAVAAQQQDAAAANAPQGPPATVANGFVEPATPVRLIPESAALAPVTMAALQSVATTLVQDPSLTKVLVEVHAGQAGRTEDKLSKTRAQALVAALQSLGVDGKRLVARGLGSSRPLAPPDLPDAVALNERVVFRVVEVNGSAVQAPLATLFPEAAAAISADGTEWNDATPVQPVADGTVVGTRDQGGAFLHVPQRAWVNLAPVSAVRVLGKAGPEGANRPVTLQLGTGAMAVDARMARAAVMVQAGGWYQNVAGSSVTVTLNQDNTVALSHQGGKTLRLSGRGRVRLAPGFGVQLAADGSAAGAAQKVLEAPSFAQPPTEPIRALALAGPGLVPVPPLNAVEGASGYRAWVQPLGAGRPSLQNVAQGAEARVAVEVGSYAVALQAVDAAGVGGPWGPFVSVKVVAAPVEGAVASLTGVHLVAVGQRASWPAGVYCNGEAALQFLTPGTQQLTCTDEEGNVFVPLTLQTVPWELEAFRGQEEMKVGERRTLVAEVSCEAPLPQLSANVEGPVRLLASDARPQGFGPVRVVRFTLELMPVGPGAARFTLATPALDSPPASLALTIADVPPPAPPPAPPTQLAPAQGHVTGPVVVGPKLVEPAGSGWKCLVDPRSWCIPAGLAAASVVAAVAASPVALVGLGAWFYASQTDTTLPVPSLALLSVGGVAGAVLLVAVLSAAVMTATAVSSAGNAFKD